MAIIKLGGVATELVGKIGGSVFQNSSYGTIMKNNRFKRSRQQTVHYARRSTFAYLSKLARALTSAERATCAANGAQFTRATKGGTNTPYNWFNWYVSFNYNRALVGLTPIKTEVSPVAEPDWSSFDVAAAGGTINWDMSGMDAVTTAWYYVVEASPMVSDGQSFYQGKMKIIQTGQGEAGSITILGANYNAVYGSKTSGRYVWFRVFLVNAATGQRSSAKITKADAQ